MEQLGMRLRSCQPQVEQPLEQVLLFYGDSKCLGSSFPTTHRQPTACAHRKHCPVHGSGVVGTGDGKGPAQIGVRQREACRAARHVIETCLHVEQSLWRFRAAV